MDPGSLAEWAMVIVSGFAVWVASKTYAAVVEQSQATSSAATATENSAATAKKAFDMAHRPRLVVRHVVVEGIDFGKIGAKLTNGYVMVANTGVTDATLLRAYNEWRFAEKLPLENPCIHAEDHATTPTPMAPRSYRKITLPEHSITTAEHSALWPLKQLHLRDARWRLFLIGYVKWQDEIGLRRRYYAYRYSPERQRFVAVSQPNYNYED